MTETRDHFYQQERLIKVRGLYPNPFSEHLGVYFTLRVDAQIAFMVYNVAGEPIKRISLQGKAGKNLLNWDGDNEEGGRCASGVYLLRLDADGVDGTVDSFWERAAVSR